MRSALSLKGPIKTRVITEPGPMLVVEHARPRKAGGTCETDVLARSGVARRSTRAWPPSARTSSPFRSPGSSRRRAARRSRRTRTRSRSTGTCTRSLGTPSGSDYSACSVVGDAISPKPFLSANTFQLTDPAITYTLQLDGSNLPETITAAFPARPSRDLISVNDNVYLITYNSVSTGCLLGQGQSSIPIANSGFKLTNPLDSTTAKFVFADLNIYDAGSVVGQFTAYLSPRSSSAARRTC